MTTYLCYFRKMDLRKLSNENKLDLCKKYSIGMYKCIQHC